jgi:ribosomal protein L29
MEKWPQAKDLRILPGADIRAHLAKLRRELWQHRLKLQDGSLQQAHQLSAMKRQIARIHTVLREHHGQEQAKS